MASKLRINPAEKAKGRSKPASAPDTVGNPTLGLRLNLSEISRSKSKRDLDNPAPMNPLQIAKNLWGGMDPKYKSPKTPKGK